MKTIDHECYISLEVAKLLKKAGFDWDINTAYRDCQLVFQANHLSDNFNAKKYEISAYEFFSAPTLDVAQRWLREIRHRSIEVKSFVDGTVDNRGKWWIWHVYDFNPPIDWVLLMSSDCRYSTYEEAQEAGIKKALGLILEKGE